MNLQTNQKGFTIVELLIVIVVIAILAAISIVAYSGIQDRARNSSAAELANQFAGKARSYQAIVGSLPTGITGTAFTPAASPAAPEASLEGMANSTPAKVTVAAAATNGTPATTDTDFWNGGNVKWNPTTQDVIYRNGSVIATISLD